MLRMKTLLWKLFAKCRKVWVRCKFVSNIYLGFCNDVLKMFLHVLEVFLHATIGLKIIPRCGEIFRLWLWYKNRLFYKHLFTNFFARLHTNYFKLCCKNVKSCNSAKVQFSITTNEQKNWMFFRRWR